jgi:hypothetical protein
MATSFFFFFFMELSNSMEVAWMLCDVLDVQFMSNNIQATSIELLDF